MLKGKKAVSEIEEFEKLLKKKPDDDRAYVRLAELYARNGNQDRAIELYEKAAMVFEKKGFLNKAKAVLKQALMINPEHGKINVLLADYDRQSGLIKDALMRYQLSANYYAKIGNKLAAINILRKIVELSPGNINFVLKLSSLLVEEKMFHEAEKLLVPLSSELKGTSKVNEYASTLKLLYTASDNDSEVGKDLVNLYLRNSSYPNALIVLQKLIIEDPEAIEFLEKLAFVFEKLGEKQKLISTYKQISLILSKRQGYEERDNVYRKILELDPNDREALSALKEDGRLRNIIAGKIDDSSSQLSEEDEDESAADLVIDVDVDIEDPGDSISAQTKHAVDAETILKEARVFMNYRLFSKAIDRVQSYPDWRFSPEMLDILIQANIESGEMNTAGDFLIILTDLMLASGKLSEAEDLLNDAESILGDLDQRIIERKNMLTEIEAFSEEDDEDEVVLAPEREDKTSVENMQPETVKEMDFLSDISSGSLLAGDGERKEEDFSEFENLASDILSELQEPPQDQLDELEFYISIEDFASATQLLQGLLINYPGSRFLAGIREILPVGKEEDLARTVKDVKVAEAVFIGEGNDPETIYDMGISSLSMGMFSEAITLFTQALEADPGNIKFMTGLAEAWAQAGKLKKSIEVLERAVKSSDDSEQTLEIEKLIEEKKVLLEQVQGAE